MFSIICSFAFSAFKQYTFQDPYEHVDRLDGYDKDEKNLYDNDIEYSKPITNRKWVKITIICNCTLYKVAQMTNFFI